MMSKNYARIVYLNGSNENIEVVSSENKAFIDRRLLSGNIDYIDFMPKHFSIESGNAGFYLYSGAKGQNEVQTFFSERPDMESVLTDICIPFYAYNNGNKAVLAIVTGMSLDIRIVVGVKNGKYYMYPRFVLEGDKVYENPEVVFLDVDDATPCGIASRYRQYQLDRGACLPLRERMKEYPVLKEAALGPEVRIRMAWKPVPSPVLEQTDENEPPIHVQVTFAQVEEILDEFHRQGIKHAEFCLVGWNKSGHDGRFPDLLPVEPLLGGEEGLRKVIRKAGKYGYLITGHTNLVDSYTIAKRWREEYMQRLKDGSRRVFGSWGGGAAYYICPKMAHEKYAGEDMEILKDLGFNGIHYFDVMTSRMPECCYDKNHPLNRKEAGEWRAKTLALARESIGGSSSEGGIDFGIGSFDYALYVHNSPDDELPEIADGHVPFWYMVYHGIIMYNAYCTTVNAMVKKDKAIYLKSIETGSRPLAYFHSKFMADGNDWMGMEDLGCGSREQLEHGVRKVKDNYSAYETISDLQFEFIKVYDSPANGIVRIGYENGTEVVVNYTDTPYAYNSITIPSMTFKRIQMQHY